MDSPTEFGNPDPAHALPPAGQGARNGGNGVVPSSGDGTPARSADSPEAMRKEIQRTRARMSRTLDTLEVRIGREKAELTRKKDALWAKATLQDFRDTITSEPWRSVAIAFVAGYIVAAIRD